MKFLANCKVFSDALLVVTKIVERRNTYPILANVHLTASAGRLTIRATDLDIEITLSIEANVAAEGVTTVPAAMLADILRKLPKDGEVKLELEKEQMLVACGRSRFHLGTLSPDSFPDLKIGNFDTQFDVAGRVLSGALDTVAFAISNEETRYYLNGVYVHAVDMGETRGEFLNFVATDGHRLAQCRREIPGAQGMRGVIIPRKTVGELIKMGDTAGDATIKFEVSDTKIRASFGSMVLLSKLIEGTFPDYERVTPKGNNLVVAVDTQQMAACVGRVSTIASEKGGKAVKLVFKEGVLTLEVTNPDHGTATDELPVEMAPDLVSEIGFNAGYLNDVLGVLGKGKANIAMLDAGAPTVFTREDDPGIKFVLMPMRV